MSEDKSKLIAAKERWAKEGRGLTGKVHATHDRLPPGQRLVTDFPVLDLGIQPEIDLSEWSLTVNGAVAQPLKWSWRDFLNQPQVDFVSDIHCVTTWSRYDNRWTGVSAAHLLAQVRPRGEACFVMLHSFDGYTTNVPLHHFAAEDSLLAHTWQGKPLSRDHGGPMRMIIPQLYLWKSAKWLRAITFMDKDEPGYWEQRGYHDVGDPWTEERYR
jgi:DMSO/TMAO reductase YedYZ molybdopterin-dependent catalytic subunit